MSDNLYASAAALIFEWRRAGFHDDAAVMQRLLDEHKQARLNIEEAFRAGVVVARSPGGAAKYGLAGVAFESDALARAYVDRYYPLGGRRAVEPPPETHIG